MAPTVSKDGFMEAEGSKKLKNKILEHTGGDLNQGKGDICAS